MKPTNKNQSTIKAVQWDGNNIEEIMTFMEASGGILNYLGGFSNSDDIIVINTHEGTVIANLNDWIIKGVDCGFSTCKPDIFKKTYKSSCHYQREKLSFDEWFEENEQYSVDFIPRLSTQCRYDLVKFIWKSAQENK